MIILEDYTSHGSSSTTDVRASGCPAFMMNSFLTKIIMGLESYMSRSEWFYNDSI
jgi:hypothetical protein